MIYNIEIKDNVRKKINDISNYIYRFSFSKESSKKVYNKIYEWIFSLKIFPNRFPEFNSKYRVLTINKKYRVFYKIDEENQTIIVSSIFSSNEDYLDILL